MKYIFVLEDDPRFQKEIWEAIQSVDPQLQVRFFSKLSEFFDWLKDLSASGPSSIARGGRRYEADTSAASADAAQLVAVVSKIEFLGARQIPLLRKTRDLFIAKGVCTAEDPTAVVLTTFVAADFDSQDLQDRILNNVILKPFDRLILIQHLTFAIDGRHPASKYTISNQKTNTAIEMLKNIEMQALSDVGFITTSDRKIAPNESTSKYYSDHFKAELKTSVHARLWQGIPLTQDPVLYQCFFYYFGLNPSQIGMLRRKVRNKPDDPKWNWNLAPAPAPKGRGLSVLMIEENDTSSAEISETLKKRIAGIQLITYKSFQSFCEDFDPSLLGEETSTEELPLAFPKDVDLTFVFDLTGQVLQSVEKSTEESVQILGVADSVLIENKFWWIQNMTPDSVGAWKDSINNRLVHVLVFQFGSQKYFIKPMFFDKDLAKKTVRVKFEELTFKERVDYKMSKTKVAQVTDVVLMSHRFMTSEDSEKWKNIEERIKKRNVKSGAEITPLLMILTSKDYSDREIRQWGQFATDLFYRPVDRVYLLQKLKLFFPFINFGKDPVQFFTTSIKERIYAANPVIINQISEAGLVMQYSRALEIGCFREFILWQAYEVAAAKIVGTCNYSEPGSEKATFNNHFVFFAINDHFLKSIRIWIRDNYIQGKEANPS